MRISSIPNWDKFIIEGESLFSYMTHNYENMIDGYVKIKHFDIEDGVFGLGEYTDEIKETYYDTIHKEAILWIQREWKEGTLFQSTNWRPFCVPDILLYMFLGYKKMFRYKQFYFQVTLSSSCEQCDVCEDCKTEENRIHFGLAFYGWKDETNDSLQPYNIFAVADDALIPESFWSIDKK